MQQVGIQCHFVNELLYVLEKQKEQIAETLILNFQLKSSKVYVSNLPDDINEESFLELMSKCGVVDIDVR
jgi:RNA recognition motif-containing protein